MAKMFYAADEAAKKLGRTEDELKALVREGKLREFRDGDTVNYKVGDIEKLIESAPTPLPIVPTEDAVELLEDSGSGASASDILLEPVDESGIELAALGGSDAVSLEESAAGQTSSGTTAAGATKGDTVVPSVGVNVFDDDDLDEHVDPLAQTAVTDVAGLGIDAATSGSGILDLTRESDDTSLGQELLDEIYTDEADSVGEPSEGTREGLAEGIPDEAAGTAAEGEFQAEVDADVEPAGKPTGSRGAVREVMEYAPDAVSASLTALLIVAVLVMCFSGLGSAALIRGIMPALLGAVYTKLWIYAAGAVGVAVISAAVTYFLRKRGS